MAKTAALLVLVAVLLLVAPARAAAAEERPALTNTGTVSGSPDGSSIATVVGAAAAGRRADTTAAITARATDALAEVAAPQEGLPLRAQAQEADPTPTTSPPPEEIIQGDGAAVLAPAISIEAGSEQGGAQVLGEQFGRGAPPGVAATDGAVTAPAPGTGNTPETNGATARAAPAATAGATRAGFGSAPQGTGTAQLAATGPARTPVDTADLAAIGLGLVAVGTLLTRRTRGPSRTSRAARPGSFRETTPLTPGRTSERGRFRLHS